MDNNFDTETGFLVSISSFISWMFGYDSGIYEELPELGRHGFF